ncbi:hypothetical protein [Candidatus Protochlamydia phocaeensis]|uniref:hypothetical protein n=1 Tax=Candidatus Protochlamydia phocaeensis TaxID=1414722 RepID=UPI0008396670|nr:hypothetical protein [Candidatus Protochlamydia phocaeensis]
MRPHWPWESGKTYWTYQTRIARSARWPLEALFPHLVHDAHVLLLQPPTPKAATAIPPIKYSCVLLRQPDAQGSQLSEQE